MAWMRTARCGPTGLTGGQPAGDTRLWVIPRPPGKTGPAGKPGPTGDLPGLSEILDLPGPGQLAALGLLEYRSSRRYRTCWRGGPAGDTGPLVSQTNWNTGPTGSTGPAGRYRSSQGEYRTLASWSAGDTRPPVSPANGEYRAVDRTNGIPGPLVSGTSRRMPDLLVSRDQLEIPDLLVNRDLLEYRACW